ncbi:MAG: hypothetical protein OIF36_05405 [Alphaproteobacteria bacterium]|nr:hypothetical protein [Alphaproteobacteria bacterium]
MNILLDMDGVILKYSKAFLDFLSSKTGTKYNIEEIKQWGFSETVKDLTQTEINTYLEEMMRLPEIEQIEPEKNAIKIIKKLKNDGHLIYIVSSSLPEDSPEITTERRTRYLNKLFGDNFFEEIYLLPLNLKSHKGHGNKQDILIQFSGNQSILLDDSIKNCEQGLSCGIKNSFLFSQNWNLSNNNLQRVMSWEEFYLKVNELKS